MTTASANRGSASTGRSPTMELLILALPIIAMMISRMLMGFIDFVMVSELGTEAQAAISPASIFIFVLGCVGLGIAHATQTFISQADGRGEPHLAGGYAWQSLYIAGFFGLLTAPIALTTSTWFPWIATLGKHEPVIMAMEIDYISVALWSIAPSIVCIGLNGFFMGVQKPWVALFAVVASLATNIVGNWLLIFGNLGFPALGIQGAAYATLGAWVVRAAVLIAAVLLPMFDRQYNTRHSLGFCWDKLKGLLRVGLPTAFQFLVDVGSWALFLIVIMPSFGKFAMAATNIGIQYMHLSFMPAIGIGIALCSQVGYAIGEGRPERAMLRARIAFQLTGIYMGLVGLAFWLGGDVLVYLFNQEDETVLELGTTILLWAAVFQVFDAMAITHMNALRGAGDTRWPAVLMGVCCWVIFIGGGLMMARHFPDWGINGPWMMCTMYIIVVGLALLWRWYGGRWRDIKLFDDRRTVHETIETPDEAPIATGVAGVDYDGPDEAGTATAGRT